MCGRSVLRAVVEVVCFAGFGIEARARGWVEVDAADVGAFGGVGGGDGAAEAGGGAGYYGGFGVETAGHVGWTGMMGRI